MHQEGVCTGPVQIQVRVDMVTMIVMEAETRTAMVMGEKGTRVMTDMVGMGTRMDVMLIGMVVTMKNAMSEMGIEMVITREEVEALMTTTTAREVGSLIETGIMLMKMMTNIPPGLQSLHSVFIFTLMLML